MAWTSASVPDQSGRVAVITGANSGLGLAAATILAERGAHVVMACRNAEKAAAAAAQVREVARGPVDVVSLDLASLASVREAAAHIQASYDRLDLLLNNAGLMAIDEARTEDGFEMQFGVNHLGHFALTALLAPLVLATEGSRIVNQSSMVHHAGRLVIDDLCFERRGYDRWRPYFQSKLANLLFTAELHRRLGAAGSTTAALAAHPGATATDLGREGTGVTNVAALPWMAVQQSPMVGALPLVRAAVDPEAKSGEFYGPQLIIRGYPRKERPSWHARNAGDARLLWEASEAMTGVAFTIPG